MSKSKSGGLPRDTLFRRTEEPAQEAAEETSTQETSKPKSRAKRVKKLQNKQRDSETQPAADDKQKTTELPRQTYYVPAELHKQLRLLALEQEINVSDLVVEGIVWVVAKYGSK